MGFDWEYILDEDDAVEEAYNELLDMTDRMLYED